MSLFGQNTTMVPTRYNGLYTSEAILGTTLPVIIGQQRASWKLLWYGDFTSQVAKQQGAGGSGLGKGGTNYVYAASVIGAVCMGPCSNFLGVWDSISRYSVQTQSEQTTVASGSYPTYTPELASVFLQDLGVGYQSAYSLTVNDYGSPGSTTYSGNQQVPLIYTSSSTPPPGYYTVNGSNQYVFNSAQTGQVVTVNYVAYTYHIAQTELDVVPNVGPYQVTVQYQAQFSLDQGVSYYPSGIALTSVSGTPTLTGTYNPNGGNYLFAPGDAGQGVTISYIYIDPDTDTNAPTTLNLTFFTGLLGQAPWSYLTSKFPSDALGYSEVAYVASSGMYLGYSPMLPQLNFEILGAYSFGNGIPDANPADAIYALLTNPSYKLNFAPQYIDPSLYAGNSSAKNQWSANGFFISALLDSQNSLMSIIGDWCEAGQVYVSWDEGRMKFIPLCDTTAVANGAVYTPPTQPIIDLDDNDFLVNDNEDPITITQTPWQNRWNRVGVRWNVRSNSYNEDILQIQDEASVQQFGLMSESAQDWQFICNETSAQFAANMRLQRLSAIYTTYGFTLGFNFAFLSPGDIITITDGLLGTSGTMFGRTPCRITKMTDDPKQGIIIEAENFPWSVGASLLYNKQAQNPSNTGDGPQEDPGNTVPIIFEVPDRAKVWSGANIYIFLNGSQVNWGGAQAYVSFNGTDYSFYGQFDQQARIGVTTADYPYHVDPDNTDTLTVNMQQSGAVLQSVTSADEDAFVTLSALVSPGQSFSQQETAGEGANLGTTGGGTGAGGSAGPTPVTAAAQKPSGSGGETVWSNIADIEGGSSYATAAMGTALPPYPVSYLLFGTGPALDVPSFGIGPVIGVKCSLQFFLSSLSFSGSADLRIYATLCYGPRDIGNGTIGSQQLIYSESVSGLPTTPTTFSVGSATSLAAWGLAPGALTPAMVNDPSFGMMIQAIWDDTSVTGSVTFNVNDCQLEVYWQGAGAAVAWTNPQNVSSSSSYASAHFSNSSVTQWLLATDFPFKLPFGFILAGISVEVDAYVDSGSANVYASLFSDGLRVGSVKAASLTNSVVTYTFGGATDEWGFSQWDLDLLNDPGFGVALSVDGALGANAFIRNVRITLYGESDYNLELIAYENATLVGQNTYALTNIRRGILGSYPCDHPAASIFARLDQATITYPVDPTYTGQYIYFKFCSFNAYGNQLQSLANVTPYAVKIGGLSPGAIDGDSGVLLTGTENYSAVQLEAAMDVMYGSYGVQNIPAGYGLLSPPSETTGIPQWLPIVTGGGGGGGVANVFFLEISGAYTANAWDYIGASTAGGSYNVTLPLAGANKNTIISLKKISSDANAVTVIPTGSDTVEAGSSFVVSEFNAAVMFVSDGVSNWEIFSGYLIAGALANDMYINVPTAAGIYTANQELFYSEPTRNVTIPSGLSGTNAWCRNVPTGSVSVALKKNGSSIGTINFAASSTTPTFTFTGSVSFNGTGDSFSITAPSTQDATFAGFGCDIWATRSN